MSEAKFTPGPWYHGQTPHQRDRHPGQRCIGLAPEADGGVFGYRLHPQDDDGSYLNISGFCSEADARLIAAAPEMLEQLEWASEVLSCMIGGSAQLDALNDVIAKARGEN